MNRNNTTLELRTMEKGDLTFFDHISKEIFETTISTCGIYCFTIEQDNEIIAGVIADKKENDELHLSYHSISAEGSNLETMAYVEDMFRETISGVKKFSGEPYVSGIYFS